MREVYGFAVQESMIARPLRTGRSGAMLSVDHRPELADGPNGPTTEVVRWQPRPGVAFHGGVVRGVDDGLYIETSDAGWYRLDVDQPAIEFAGNSDDIAVQVRTWITPMLLLMTRKRLLPLHAAAVRTAQGVVAIGAPGKHGKTTLAAALHAAGCPLYAEDITCVDGREVLAGPGLLRLRRDAEHRFDLGTLTELGRTTDRVFLHDPSPQPGTAPLRAVVLLREGNDIELESRSGPSLRRSFRPCEQHRALRSAPAARVGCVADDRRRVARPVRRTRVKAVAEKVRTLVAVWLRYVKIRRLLRRHRLAEVTQRLAGPGKAWSSRNVAGMSHAVDRALLGPAGPIRCLPRALVLYSLLREHSVAAELVIGVEPSSRSHEAHAWVEVGGRDVGPRPGRMGRAELARYPRGESDVSAPNDVPTRE